MVMTEYLLEEASITREGPYALRSYGFLDKAKYSHWTITWQVTNWQLGVQHVSFSLSQMDTSEFSHALGPFAVARLYFHQDWFNIQGQSQALCVQ